MICSGLGFNSCVCGSLPYTTSRFQPAKRGLKSWAEGFHSRLSRRMSSGSVLFTMGELLNAGEGLDDLLVRNSPFGCTTF